MAKGGIGIPRGKTRNDEKCCLETTCFSLVRQTGERMKIQSRKLGIKKGLHKHEKVGARALGPISKRPYKIAEELRLRTYRLASMGGLLIQERGTSTT